MAENKIEMLSIDDWQKVIRKECKANGTYQSTDEQIIRILSEIMAKRCIAENEFITTGGHTVITQKNSAGKSVVKKNPILQNWIDLTAAALPYWKELGLSPSARKRVTGETVKTTKANALAEALKGL